MTYHELSDQEKNIVDNYKSNEKDFCYQLNDNLRKGETPEEVELLDQIIDKLHMDKTLELYRATVERNILPFINDNIYINPEYLSTSITLDRAQYHFTDANAPVLMILKCSAKTKKMDLELNVTHGDFEKEVLIGRNERFQITQCIRISERSEIEFIMGRDFAVGVSSLKIIELHSED